MTFGLAYWYVCFDATVAQGDRIVLTSGVLLQFVCNVLGFAAVSGLAIRGYVMTRGIQGK